VSLRGNQRLQEPRKKNGAIKAARKQIKKLLLLFNFKGNEFFHQIKRKHRRSLKMCDGRAVNDVSDETFAVGRLIFAPWDATEAKMERAVFSGAASPGCNFITNGVHLLRSNNNFINSCLSSKRLSERERARARERQ